MHELAPLIKDLAIILGIASIITLLFQKIRQPIVLGYLVAGIIIGPYTPPYMLVTDVPNIKILSELGVIFLMFSLGLEFSFRKLSSVGLSASITGSIEVVFMLLFGMGAGKLLGWSFFDSLFFGAALAISSTTIIIKALEELHLKKKRFAEIVFGILIIEDLLAILLMVGLTTIVATDNIFSSDILWSVAKLILVVGGWFLIGYFALPSLFRKIMQYASEETLTIVSVSLCLMLVCIAAYFHYSSALGAFIMGSILAETPLVHKIQELIQPLRDVFAAVFFVSIGMLIEPVIIWQQWEIILLICVVVIVGKLVSTSTGTFLTGQSVNSSLRIGFSMAQIGEFSFIIIGLGMALNVISDSLYSIIVAVSAITTFTTPYFIQFSGHIEQKLLAKNNQGWMENYTNWVLQKTSRTKRSSIYGAALIRFSTNSVITAVIFVLTQSLLLSPKTLECLIAMVLASPFVWGMLSAFRDNTKNRFILFFVGLVTLTVISILSFAYFNTWVTTVLLVLSTLFFMILFHKPLDKIYYWLEGHLIKNLNSN